MALRTVVVGATGVFGSRIARRLAHDARFELILAGRRAEPLETLYAAIGAGSRYATRPHNRKAGSNTVVVCPRCANKGVNMLRSGSTLFVPLTPTVRPLTVFVT